jgi:hypothetical protein
MIVTQRPRPFISGLALWSVIFALLLKGAVPMLAAVAAQMRGVPVADLCTIYGVALPPSTGHQHHHAGHSGGRHGHQDHGSDSAAGHSADHCALNALAALAAPELPNASVPRHDTAPAVLVAADGILFPDAVASWAALLQHGPPTLA